jgi:hypothetical protein
MGATRIPIYKTIEEYAKALRRGETHDYESAIVYECKKCSYVHLSSVALDASQ